jgi:hypothetical protein
MFYILYYYVVTCLSLKWREKFYANAGSQAIKKEADLRHVR